MIRGIGGKLNPTTNVIAKHCNTCENCGLEGILMRNRLATLLVIATIALAASPANAGRGTQIDNRGGLVTACQLGSTSCTGIDVSNSGLFRTAYVYREGIVSFDRLLPAGVTSTDLSTFGGVSFFSAGFLDTADYKTALFKSTGSGGFTSGYLFSFYRQGDVVSTPGRFPGDPPSFNAPYLQVQLRAIGPLATDGSFNGIELGAGYGPNGAEPLANALIGFSVSGVTQTVRNAGGLLIGPDKGDSDIFTRTTFIPGTFGSPPSWSAPTNFTPLYGPVPGLPEPSVWMTLVLGIGAIGGAMRRATRRAVRLSSVLSA